MITIENRVGRLMEGRFEGHLTPEQLKAFGAELARLMIKAGRRLVFVVDWRTCEAPPPEVELMLVGQARSDNFAIERSAHLTSAASTGRPTVEKIVAMGRNPNRVAFLSLPEMMNWVTPVLELPEIERAQAFMAERPTP
jgi:hypothetical protein